MGVSTCSEPTAGYKPFKSCLLKYNSREHCFNSLFEGREFYAEWVDTRTAAGCCHFAIVPRISRIKGKYEPTLSIPF
jgi:hypothetical protein